MIFLVLPSVHVHVHDSYTYTYNAYEGILSTLPSKVFCNTFVHECYVVYIDRYILRKYNATKVRKYIAT